MATAIVDIDLAESFQELNSLYGYANAFVLVRLNQKPVGQLWLPVIEGKINSLELKSKAIEAAGSRLWEHLLLHNTKHFDSQFKSRKSLPRVTVAVCTRERPKDLKRCLSGLMKLADMNQEFLVIDNAPSTQDTFHVVQQFPQVRYILEEKPGLDVARNRAIREASHEIVAFTDDDAVPDSEWLEELLHNFQDPRVLCVTGLVVPIELETSAQEEFERHNSMSKGYERRVFDGTLHNPLLVGRIGAGANMALRRNIMSKVGAFDEALDCGTATKSGGDHEMFSRILASGYHIVYEPAAVCWHRHRRDWKSLRKTYYGYGVGVYASWTRSLLCGGEFGVFQLAWGWFWFHQFPNILKSLLKRPKSVPIDLLLAEICGCFVGPWAYLSSRRFYKNYKKSNKNDEYHRVECKHYHPNS